MHIDLAVGQLAALAQQTRLMIFKNLVVAGSAGIGAGELATRAMIAPNALSFHAKELRHAGLIRSETCGRNVIYLAELDAMSALIAYLLENCCVGFDGQASAAALACAKLSAPCCAPSLPSAPKAKTTIPRPPKSKLSAIQ